jgi:hypothetical protein
MFCVSLSLSWFLVFISKLSISEWTELSEWTKWIIEEKIEKDTERTVVIEIGEDPYGTKDITYNIKWFIGKLEKFHSYKIVG